MVERLASSDSSFEERLREIAQTRREAQRKLSEDCHRQVAEIIAAIEAEGDKALRLFAKRWDGLNHDLNNGLGNGENSSIRIANDDIARAAALVPELELRALRVAARRIKLFHKQQGLRHYALRERNGMRLDARVQAISDVGLYVPGGRNCYPSSLLMTAIPARIANVARLVVTTPLASGASLSPLLAAALQLLEIEEVYRIGGAQAIAALALGTESIKAVDLIVGPGNLWVNTAKQQLFGRVGIDTIAGASELLILADSTASPHWLAADLLAQAEHDPQARPLLISDEATIIDEVIYSLDRQLPLLARREIAEQSWHEQGLCLLVKDLTHEGVAIANILAPEHVQIIARKARSIAAQLRNVGAIFIGAYSPEAIGDYIAGPNHVLPTARAARFASGLGVETFTKRINIIEANYSAFSAIAPHAISLAQAEGLQGHARSLQIRQKMRLGGNKLATSELAKNAARHVRENTARNTTKGRG